MFFGRFLSSSIKLRREKRYSCLAVPDDCTFFPIVICNLIKEPAKKYSNEPAKTIQHCNQWPDDCTFFSGHKLIKESAKTIQAHRTPKHSNSQITICCVKIQTPPITLQFKKNLIGFLYFTETMRSKLSVTVYLFLALY
jgi:hypothetical protein